VTAGPSEDLAPVLRVVRGNPTADELAALVAVLAVLGSGSRRAADEPVSSWRSGVGMTVRPLPHGPDAWRVSGLPR
jgi:Acyl-CoA carboxylase epsilon subunit